MTLKHTHIILISFWLLASSMLSAGGLEKGLQALEKKDYYGAKKQFEKILFKEPVGGNYGLSLVHYEKQNPFYDIDRSLRYCNSADSAFQFALPKDRDDLREHGIDGTSIKEHRKNIGIRAYEDLMEDPSDVRIEEFLDKYRFSERYPKVVSMRDERAFASARQEDSFESYRQFIIDYPGAAQRAEADSLYALKFFEVKTASGSIDGYKQFVKEFPANPYSDQAYDTIYSWTKKVGTYNAYQKYLIDYPDNKNTFNAWRAVNLILLRDYTEKNLEEVIVSLTRNPFKEQLEKELSLFSAKRFVMETEKGTVLIDQNGVMYGEVYDEIAEFNEGLAKVTKDGKSGFVNKLGEVVIPLEFDDVFAMSSGLAVVESKGRFGAIDRFGRMSIPLIYDELGNANYGLLAFEKDGRSGFVDWTGSLEFNRYFEFTSDFKNGYSIVKVEGLYGAIDTSGRYTIPALYDWVEESMEGYSRVRRADKFGLYQHGNKLTIPISYDKIGVVGSGVHAVVDGELLGYLNMYGDTVIAPQFAYSQDIPLAKFRFNKSLATVREGEKWGLIDLSGDFVVSPEFDELVYNGYGVMPYRVKNKWGFVTTAGEKLPGSYSQVEVFNQGLAKVQIDGKFGMVNSIGKLVIPAEYEYLESIQDTELIIFSDNVYKGIMNREGVVVLAPDYEDIETLNIRFVKLHFEGKEQLYDLTDSEVKWTYVE